MDMMTRLEALKSALQAAMPFRTVTRALKDFGDRDQAQLRNGVYTLVSKGARDYRNYNGTPPMGGRHELIAVGQIVLDESAEPDEVEDAELDMVEELKAAIVNLPPAVCTLELKGFVQSMQLEAPYGWVQMRLEMEEG